VPTSALATVAVYDPPLAAGALGVEDDEDDDDPDDVVAGLPVSTAAIADLLSEEFDGAEVGLLAAIVTPLADVMDGTEVPVPP
jgi:hypothetical protein